MTRTRFLVCVAFATLVGCADNIVAPRLPLTGDGNAQPQGLRLLGILEAASDNSAGYGLRWNGRLVTLWCPDSRAIDALVGLEVVVVGRFIDADHFQVDRILRTDGSGHVLD